MTLHTFKKCFLRGEGRKEHMQILQLLAVRMAVGFGRRISPG